MKFSIIILTLLLVGILSDIYITRRFLKNKTLRLLFLIKSIVMNVSIASVMTLTTTGSTLLSHATTIWFFVIYFLIYLPQIIFFLISVFDYTVRWRRKSFRYFTITGGVAATILMLTIIYGITYGRSVARIEPISLKSTTLPESFDNYKIVQLSDIHIGNYGTNKTIISSIVEKVNALNPDAIMITGDLVNLKANELEPFTQLLSQLKAKDGVFSILGNHDYGDYVIWNSQQEKKDNLKKLIQTQSDMGWKMLNNDHAVIKKGSDSIIIIGVENWGLPPFRKVGDLTKSYPDLKDSAFKILLSHNPTHWDAEVIPQSNIDLTLSGHTHAMQMKLNIRKKSYSLASTMYLRWSGLYTKGEQHLYVNDGIGYVGIPLRIGTQPEITEITLKKHITQ